MQNPNKLLKTDDFDYSLPAELIAQSPLERRALSRLLLLADDANDFTDTTFSALEACLHSGDTLVLNDTRVIPARLYCYKQGGGKVEIMLERVISRNEIVALARTNKPLKLGQMLYINQVPVLEYTGRDGQFFRFSLAQANDADAYKLFHQSGNIPLPPYIKRQPVAQDVERYQTVYAQREGAVAAPTAGLHFEESTLARIRKKGVHIETITLHVGAGTFQPVRSNALEAHQMHAEWCSVSEGVVNRIRQSHAAGKKVIGVGTTTVRALETAALNGSLQPWEGQTDIFIYPGFKFKVVDALLTNFHLPKSTLLMMVCAFGGVQRVKDAYVHAVKQGYRFFSYGDAMFLERRDAV